MDPVWNLNPLNVRNNVNGVGDIAWPDYVSMRDGPTFERQLEYALKIVREVNDYDNVYCRVWRFRDGKIAALTEYMDTELARRRLWT